MDAQSRLDGMVKVPKACAVEKRPSAGEIFPRRVQSVGANGFFFSSCARIHVAFTGKDKKRFACSSQQLARRAGDSLSDGV